MNFYEIDGFDINSSGLITYNVDWEVLEIPPIKITKITIGRLINCMVNIYFSTIYDVSEYKIVHKIFFDKFKVSLNRSDSFVLRHEDITVLVCHLSLGLYENFNPYYQWSIGETH